MLTERKITIEEKTVVNGKPIALHRAVIEGEKILFLPHQIDAEACKSERKILREDQAAFEDSAYLAQEKILKGEF